MARVVYTPTQTVEPGRPPRTPRAYFEPQMPNLGIVGAAAQRGGQQIEGGANELAASALRIQELHNQTNAEQSITHWLDRSNDLLYGEDGLFSKTGDAFLKARAGVQQQLDQIFQETGAALGNEQAQNFFFRDAGYQRVYYNRMIGRASAEAVRANALDTSRASIVASARAAANSYNDPDALGAQFQTIGRSMQRLSDLGDRTYQGRDPIGVGAVAAIEGAIARGDWSAAASLNQQYGSHIEPGTRAELGQRIETRAAAANGDAIAGRLWRGEGLGAPSGALTGTIADRAKQLNIDPGLALGTARIESGTGRNLGPRGNIFQLGPNEWGQAGGGDMADPNRQIDNGLRWLGIVKGELRAALGREPTNSEIYLAHQQGVAGATALLGASPGTPAGKVVAPENIRANGGDPNAPASQFVDLWRVRYERAAGFPVEPGGTAPRAPTAAAPGGLDLAFGDSIAVQQIRHGIGGREGPRGGNQAAATAVVGDTPQQVLARIRATPAAQFAGKTIFLSPGTSNNPAQVAMVGQELDVLRQAGAKAVVVPGVGPGVPNQGAVNAQLKQIADQHGAAFFVPDVRWQADGIHPAEVDKVRAQALAALGAGARPAPLPPGPGPGRIDHLFDRIDRAEDAGEISPLEAEHARAGLTRRYREWSTAHAGERQALKQSLTDGIARLADGKPFDYDPARIRALFAPEEAESYIAALNDAHTAGAMKAEMGNETPAEIAANRAKLAQGLDDPGAPDYARRRKLLSIYDSTATHHLKALGDDPAGYIASLDPALEQQGETALSGEGPQAATAFAAYAAKMIGRQEQLGLDPATEHLLSARQSQGYAQQLVDDPEHAPERMRAMAQRFGTYWPGVWRDLSTIGKLPAAWQAVGQLADYDPQNAALLARQLAQQTGAKTGSREAVLAARPGEGAQPPEAIMEQTIYGDPRVMQFDRSLADGFVSQNARNGVFGAIGSLARARAIFLGENPAVAARNAVDAIVGHFRFNGAARAPAAIFDDVEARAQARLDGLTTASIAIPPYFAGGPQPTAGDYLAHLKSSPTWINAPQGNAWWLLDAGGRIVRDGAARPVAVPFAAAPTISPAAQPAAIVPTIPTNP